MLDSNIPRPHTVTRSRVAHGEWFFTAIRPDNSDHWREPTHSSYTARKTVDGKWRVFRFGCGLKPELVGVVATLADVRTALFDNEF